MSDHHLSGEERRSFFVPDPAAEHSISLTAALHTSKKQHLHSIIYKLYSAKTTVGQPFPTAAFSTTHLDHSHGIPNAREWAF